MHIKVTSNGGVYGRFSYNPNVESGPGSEQEARTSAAKVIDMHKSHKGDKTATSPSSSASYEIVNDDGKYPLG
jgi:hypothetical protein